MQAQYSDYFELLRVKHWYKNLILYLHYAINFHLQKDQKMN